MFQFSSRRNRDDSPYRPLRPPAQQEDDSQLDWAFGDIVSPEIIELTPTRPSEEREHEHFQPRSAEVVEASPPPLGPERPISAATHSLTAAYRGAQAAANLQALEAALEDALDDWWSEDKLPTKALLREGLLALQAGHDLDEGQRTLLLRTALAYNRGVLSALRYQTDGDRTAFLLKGVILDIHKPLPPVELARLLREDAGSEMWVVPLKRELQDEMAAVGGLPHELASRGLAVLEGKPPPPALSIKGQRRSNGRSTGRAATIPPQFGYWSPGRRVLLFLLMACLLLAFVQPGSSASTTQITIPGGDYHIRTEDETEPLRQVTLAEFQIDHSEVTNANYRQCLDVGHCSRPSSLSSVNQTDYFLNPTFDHYPMVNVTQAAAERFCRWLGKRLPTAGEWMVAASVAPITQRANRYPWGDLYEPQRANVRQSGWGAARPVGSYSPFGDSAFGIADMAGNVAEWTTTRAGNDDARMVVKGGSFLDGAAQVATTSMAFVDATTAEPWLGFRCVAD